MREPLTFEDLEELPFGGTAESQREMARSVEAWADAPHPDDEPDPAALLVRAGEHRTWAGDHEASLALVRRAVELGGDVPPDVRCYLVAGLLGTAAVDEAREVADGLRRSGPASADVHLFVGEAFETTGDLASAHRWFTMGTGRLLRTEDVDPESSAHLATLTAARARVREDLGLPADALDEESRERRARRWHRDDDGPG